MLFAAGLALRLPWLMEAPPLTDEVDGIRLANEISRGRALPLADVPSSYYGPFHTYLLAALYALGARSFFTARLLAAVAGALTPLAVYWLTTAAQPVSHGGPWRLPRRTAPVLAALLTLTSAPLVAIDSHIFWPTSFTPLLLALTLGCYLRAVRRQDAGAGVTGRWLVAAGALGALTLQTAPQLVAALPGFALHYLTSAQRRRMLARPAANPSPYLAAVAFVVVYSPLLIHNLLTAGASVRDAATYTEHYAFGPVTGVPDYLWNLRNLLSLLARVMGSNLLLRPQPWELFQIAAGSLLLAGGVWHASRAAPPGEHTGEGGRRVLVWVIATTVLLMPLYNRGYYAGFPIQVRYLCPLLPAAFCAMALFVTEWLAPATWRLAAHAGQPAARAAAGALGASLALLVVLPVISSLAYYRHVEEIGRSNAPTFAALERLGEPGEGTVTLSAGLEQEKLGPGNDLLRTTQVWLELRGRPYVVR